MALNAVPKRWVTTDDYVAHDMFGPDPLVGTGDLNTFPRIDEDRKTDGLVVECVLVHPPSMAGKTVFVQLAPADVTDLLLNLRKSAVEARRQVASR